MICCHKYVTVVRCCRKYWHNLNFAILGQFRFDRIGSSYPEAVPLFALRLVPAVCGSLIIPTTYHLMLELGLTQWTAALAGFLLLCGMYVYDTLGQER